MGTPALYDMMILQQPTVGKNIMTEAVWLQKGYDNTGTYFKISELRSLIEKTLEVISNDPQRISRVHQTAFRYNRDLFRLAGVYLKTDFRKLSNSGLAKKYNQIINLFIRSHGYALPTTWFLDSDGEDFSSLLFKKIETRLDILNLKLNPAETFTVLTTPDQQSLAVKEEIESIKVALTIKGDPKARNIFIRNSSRKIEKKLDSLNPPIKRLIKSHFKKWRWQSYTYMGPAYDLDYYLEVWSGLLKQKINLEKELSRLLSEPEKIKRAKAEIVKILGLPTADRKTFKIAQEIIYLKSYRKDAWFFTCFALEGLYKEIGRRLDLSLNQVWFMSWQEVGRALKKGDFPIETINQRMNFCAYRQKGLKAYFYTGRQAEKFLRKIRFEKEKKIPQTSELKGTCAFPGRAEGAVKIINQVEDMGKMDRGDVMLAHTTYPALVPAMKKASAIVTDDGGVTCHAAIVARELKIPGVVGTKIATKVLHDGDRVEVDATKGIIKKI